MKKLLMLFVLAVAALTSAQEDREGWPEVLRYGVLPTEEESLETQRGPFFRHLERELGIPVEYYIGNDYGAIIVAMSTGRIEAAHFGPEAYVLATENADVEAVALADSIENGTGYYSGLWTHQGSGIESLEDARGKTLAFVDPASTSGYLVPMVYLLRDLGIRPEEYFSNIVFAGNHSSSLLSLANAHVDVAAISFTTVERALKEGQIAEGELVNLWKSEKIPGSPIAVRGDLPESFKRAFQQAVLSFDDPEGLANLGIRGYVATDDRNYDVIRALNEVKNELLAQQ